MNNGYQYDNQNYSRYNINGAALDRLLAARAPGEFAEGWRRISDNFDLLYDVPENVGALRQAILQLAVMGKLVEQDEKDEPAEVLIDKIDNYRFQSRCALVILGVGRHFAESLFR